MVAQARVEDDDLNVDDSIIREAGVRLGGPRRRGRVVVRLTVRCTWIMAVDVAALMSKLSEKRGAFHSEADFQLAFAWELQHQHPSAQVRLETRPTQGQHLDVLVRDGGRELAIELKYLTAAWDGEDEGEELHLLNHGAQDIRGYDCVKDLVRVESFVSSRQNATGLVVVLSNDPSYWRPSTHGRETNASQFRLRDGTVLEGSRAWGALTGDGTKKDRTAELILVGRYVCTWKPYSNLDGRRGEFRYLALEVS